jgi:hypothetical protein
MFLAFQHPVDGTDPRTLPLHLRQPMLLEVTVRFFSRSLCSFISLNIPTAQGLAALAARQERRLASHRAVASGRSLQRTCLHLAHRDRRESSAIRHLGPAHAHPPSPRLCSKRSRSPKFPSEPFASSLERTGERIAYAHPLLGAETHTPRHIRIVCGSDDFHVRVFNYNTQERVTSFEAHPDYIRSVYRSLLVGPCFNGSRRCLAVHPTQSLVLTGSDDMTIKLWDWEKNWKCVQVSPYPHPCPRAAPDYDCVPSQIFEGHTHYIMGIAFNPKDSNTFASACLDRTVKVWSLGSHTANFTLDAHDKGVNYVEYYHGGDRPYLVTTGDDRLVKVWDYHSKSCIQTLEGHTSNVSFAIFHPSLPIIVSGSEDGTVKIWHSSTYRLENTLNYGLERAWCVTYAKKGSNDVAFGFDEGAVVVKLGKEEPSVSMDVAGKIVYTKNAEVFSASVQGMNRMSFSLPLPPRLP